VCVESKTAECTTKDLCKILAIGAKVLSSRRYYSRVFRHLHKFQHYSCLFSIRNFTSCFLFARLAHGGTHSAAVPASRRGVWSIASYSSKIFSPACNLPERDSLFRLFPMRLDPFSLHGSSFSVLAVPQLWPLTRIRSIVQNFSTPV
jgi:hypothetical protein